MIQPRARDQQRLTTQKRAVNPVAYENYLRGRVEYGKRTQEGLNNAIQYYRKTLDADPSYAPAYVGLAESWESLANYAIQAPAQART